MPLISRLRTAVLSAVAVLAFAAAAHADASVSVQPASSRVRPGQSVSVTVALAGAVDAYAFQFDVRFDPDLVKLTSVTNGGFLPDGNFSPGIPHANGSVTFVYDLLTGPVSGISGGGALATLTFETFADRFASDPVAIHITNLILLDSAGHDVAVSAVTDGTLSYLDDVPPVTAATASPAANTNGWNATGVSVHLAATDGGSGVKEIRYSISGAGSASGAAPGASADVDVSAEGVSVLSYSAVDDAGNVEADHTLTLRVDQTPPVLTVPADLAVEATSAAGAAVSFAASAHDALSGDLPVALTPPSGSTFPLGTTTVSAQATDLAGHTATAAFHVTVGDTTAPVITALAASPSVLWPPNHKMVPIAIAASVSDAVDPSPVTRIVSVGSNEDTDGGDWDVTGPLALSLRAERSGKGSGRVYSIVVESRDRFGNASRKTVTVTVPHNP